MRETLARRPEDTKRLRESLDIIFENLQCLPASLRPDGAASRGVLWSARDNTLTGDNSIEIIVNGSYYRLERIGETKQTRKRCPPVKANKGDIERALYAMNNSTSLKMAKKVATFQNRGTRQPRTNKGKNRRGVQGQQQAHHAITANRTKTKDTRREVIVIDDDTEEASD